MLRAAAAAVGRGLAVFPVEAHGRRPLRPDWREHVIDDVAGLVGWPDGANVGVGCRASQIVVLDLDVEGDGIGTLNWHLARLREPWPDTLTVSTPSGGRHVYFRAPARLVPSSSGGITRLGPGIDVRAPGRAHGGYVIGPGSVIGGRTYEIWREAPMLALPNWLGPLLRPRRK